MLPERHGHVPRKQIRLNRFARRFAPFAHRTLNIFLATGLLLLGSGAPNYVRGQAAPGGYEAAMQRLDTVMTTLERLRASIDRSSFDVEALGFELVFEEPEDIAGWVEENIAYQPYRGLLRGADGTLLERAGNALDQAVLLATLLNSSGYEARIALTELDSEQAQSLLDSAAVGTALRESADEALASELSAALADLADLPGIDVVALQDAIDDLLAPAPASELTAEAAGTTQQLAAALAAGGITLGSNMQAELISEAQQYAWVEYRLAEGYPWQAAHPAAPKLADADLTAETVLSGNVPEEMQHRLRVEVEVESKVGNELVVAPVMTPWERPVANAIGTVLTYTNTPSGAAAGNSADGNIAAILDRSDFFIPNFMGAMPEGAQAFDLDGVLLAPEDAGSAFAGVFRTVGKGFQSAVSALGALGGGDSASDEPMALTSQWLTLTLIAPGGEEQVFRRTLFDRVGAENRAAGAVTLDGASYEEAELALISEHRIMAFASELPKAYLIDSFLTGFIESRPFLEYIIAIDNGLTPDRLLDEALTRPSQLEHLVTMDLFNTGPAGQAGLSYRAEPALLIFRESLAGTRDDSVVVSGVDIVTNARRVLERQDGQLVADAQRALNQGVWETVVEREIVAPGERSFDTTATIERALNAGATLRTVSTMEEAAALELDATALSNLSRDLNAGYVAVLPGAFAAGDDVAWWRVRAATGEALGITADGRGQSATEYIIQAYDMSFTLVFAVKSLADCDKLSDDLAKACCLVKAHINNVAGLGMGSALGGLLGGGLAGAVAGLSFTLTSGVLGYDITGLGC